MTIGPEGVDAVCCGIFRKELESLGPGVFGGARPLYLDSMMHMRPAQLDQKLLKLTAACPERRFLLVYGDCCPHMSDLARRPGIRKVEGVNCCEVFLGRESYRALRREGAFLFLPEWVERWEEVFKRQLGLEDKALARDFMHDLHKRLIYVDTGVVPAPGATLAAIEAHFDMPVEVLGIGLEHLSEAISSGLRRVADAK